MPENTRQSCALKKQKLFEGNKHISLHLGRNYIFSHNNCFSRLTVFLERRSRKNDRSSEQIVSTDKYPWLFSRQMKVIVYSFTPTLVNSYLMSYERECARRKILRHQALLCFLFLFPSCALFIINIFRFYQKQLLAYRTLWYQFLLDVLLIITDQVLFVARHLCNSNIKVSAGKFLHCGWMYSVES